MSHTATSAKETGNRFEAPEEYVGYDLRDPEGRKIGSVKELFTNADGEPEYVRIKFGFLGLRSVLIPVGFVALDEERRTLTLQ